MRPLTACFVRLRLFVFSCVGRSVCAPGISRASGRYEIKDKPHKPGSVDVTHLIIDALRFAQ